MLTAFLQKNPCAFTQASLDLVYVRRGISGNPQSLPTASLQKNPCAFTQASLDLAHGFFCGRRGIRTPGTVTRTTV